MAKKVINVGTTANDATGDSLRTAGGKINDNFTELYNALGGETGAPLTLVSSILPGKGIAISAPAGNVLITNKTATADEIGGIRIGNGINIDDNGIATVDVYELPKASNTILGGVRVGDRLSIDADGYLSADPGAYSLPKASDTVLGGIKVGTGLAINPAGVLSVTLSEYSLPTATNSTLGGIKVGARLSIVNGVLSADPQTVGITSTLVNGDATVSLGTDGRLTLPSQGVSIKDGITTIPNDTTTVIYSTAGAYVRAIKLLVFAEKFTNGYESYASEVIAMIHETTNEIYSTVYGVVASGDTPLINISSEYILETGSFNILATPSTVDGATIRTYVTEMYGTD